MTLMARLGLAVVLLCVACASADPPPPLVRLHLTADLHIGGQDEGPTSFADVRGFAVDGSGHIYILEAQAQQVRVFDSLGALVHTIGRKGAGPGEFEMANGLYLGPRDQLWVYDPGNARVSVFDTSGVLRSTYPLNITGYGYTWDGVVDTAGRLYDEGSVPDGDSTVSAILHRTLSTGHVDTLKWPPCPVSAPPAYRYPRGFAMVPYSNGLFRRLDDRGFVWCGDTKTLRLFQFLVGDSTPLRTFEAPAEPAPVTSAERDSAVQGLQEHMKRAGSTALDYSRIPSAKPILVRADPDDRGRLWAQIEARDGWHALVFDSGGVLRAEVQLPFPPHRWLPLIVRDNHLFTVTRDSLDTPGITRFLVE